MFFSAHTKQKASVVFWEGPGEIKVIEFLFPLPPRRKFKIWGAGEAKGSALLFGSVDLGQATLAGKQKLLSLGTAAAKGSRKHKAQG